MEKFESPFVQRKQNAMTKKRSQIPRRPRTASIQFLQMCDRPPIVTTRSRDDINQISSDDHIARHTNPRTKEFNLSQCTLSGSRDTSSSHSKILGNGVGAESKVKRVKLKVGSVTHTIETKYSSLGIFSGGSSETISRNTESARTRPKLILQDNSDEDFAPPDKKTGLRENSYKNGSNFDCRGEKLNSVRKSKKLSNKHVSNGGFDEADEDDEIRYLKKLKFSKFAVGSEDSGDDSSKKIKIISRGSTNAKLDETSEGQVSSRSSKSSDKSRAERGSDGTDYEDGSPIESIQELGLTTRQRALLSSKGGSYISGASEIEFPNGLPPAPKRQKEKLSETDQQLKKAEAAQRRKMQAEKAAKESEAEAIRKILGQDSNRKKKEDKIKKRMDDMAQEKAANALTLPSNTVRWVISTAGTVVTFSNDLGLPSIFNHSPCNYPAPRESCVGPSCTNPYKYRDSKSKLPLCSLRCYKAVREEMQTQAIV